MSRLETLKTLESTLVSFLEGAVEIESDRLSNFKSIDMLEEIASDCLRGRYINNRLGNWLAVNRNILDTHQYDEKEVSMIGNLLDDIKKGLDESDPGTKKLTSEIADLKEHGFKPKRKLVLKLHHKAEENKLLDDLNNMLKTESKIFDSGEYSGKHLLTALDDILKSAELKPDPMYVHLAASMIYFLKMNGYKISPFVKRLKEIEKNKFGSNFESGTK
ncbi:MAG: hypothetical protein ABIJ45_13890 [Candidatus Zixiibacteriota bacterium]